jgi:4-hydroxy-4-methyl-2-oxoglutarate aldolase
VTAAGPQIATMPIDRQTISAALIERCAAIGTSTWSDALDRFTLPGVLTRLERRAGALPFAGPIVTVAEEVGRLGSANPRDFGIDRILADARLGDVLLIQQHGVPPASAIGGLAALSAQRHGVRGIVIDGACRDVDELADVGLPVLSRGTTPASGRGRARITGVNVALCFEAEGLEVVPGDLLVADETGVVVVPAGRLDELLVAAEERALKDAAEAERLRA